MRNRRKWLIVVLVLCSVIGVSIPFLSPPDRSIKLPDGSVLTFEGVAYAQNIHYEDGKLNLGDVNFLVEIILSGTVIICG